jgi:protein-disulfide isomerase
MIRKEAMTIFLLSAFAWAPPLAAQRADRCLGGQPDAPIKMEVFSDFQCPACRQFFFDIVRPVLKDYASRDKVCVLYRTFPLSTLHRYAREAARYSLAAQKLGQQKWQAVVNSIYADQPKWSQDGSLDSAVFKVLSNEDYQLVKKNLRDPALDKIIDEDIALGEKRAVRQTPTFFLYYMGEEQRVDDSLMLPYTILKEFIDQTVK